MGRIHLQGFSARADRAGEGLIFIFHLPGVRSSHSGIAALATPGEHMIARKMNSMRRERTANAITITIIIVLISLLCFYVGARILKPIIRPNEKDKR
jgi:hypothetical protein